MANLWEKLVDEGWVRTELHQSALIGDSAVEPVDPGRLVEQPGKILICLCATGTGSDAWLLLAPCDSAVFVNDSPVGAGVLTLADRDAIRLPGPRTLYFSTERLPRIESFPDSDNVFCPRCKLPIDSGDDAVRCPGCGIWHHESAAGQKPCWSYAETCSLCDQPTAIAGAEFRWTPERL